MLMFLHFLWTFYHACWNLRIPSEKQGTISTIQYIHVYAKLYQSCVEPVIYYVAGVWGTDLRRIIQFLQTKAARYFHGSKKNYSNNLLLIGSYCNFTSHDTFITK